MGGEYSNLNDLTAYVYNSIGYIHDVGSEYFQSPKETDEYLLGDCEDYAIAFMFLAHRDFGIKPSMQIVKIENKGYHALAYYQGAWYDPTNNFVFGDLPDGWHKVIKWNYDIIMLYATNFYTKGEINGNTN
jgi:hypothetical protein